MSCSNRNIRNLDTTVYRPSSCCCQKDDGVTIQFVDRTSPCCHCGPFFPPYPIPPVTPPVPPQPPVVTPTPVTGNYALLTNTAATGATYTAGEAILFPDTVFNTDRENIVSGTGTTGTVALSGSTGGRAYLVDYQASGTVTDTTLGLFVNGVNIPASNATVAGTGENQSLRGGYIVYVPANTTAAVSLNVVSGTFATAAPTSGTSLRIVRIV